MSFAKICVVALLFCACAVTARTLNKEKLILDNLNQADVAVERNYGSRNLLMLSDEQEECNCGEFGVTCELVNEKKVCTCIDGYKDNHHGVCITCSCSIQDPYLECSYDENITQVCACREGYLKGRDNMCQKSCSTEEPCHNGGECEHSLCKCLPGTRGDKCEVVEPCTSSDETWKKCGYVMGVVCLFNPTSRSAYCGCTDIKKGYDERERRCKEKCASHAECENGGKCENEICNCMTGTKGDRCEIIEKCVIRSDVVEMCGDSLTTCEFNQTSLKPYCSCILPDVYGYNAQLRECLECFCGVNSTGCIYRERTDEEESDDYEKVCKCHVGYAQNEQGQCEECDCGENATCNFKGPEQICVCNEGFELINDTCEALATTSNPTDETSLKTTPHTPTVSTSSPTDGTSMKTTSHTPTGSHTTDPYGSTVLPKTESTGWRTSTIVLGILFAICLIGLVFGIYRLKYRNYHGV